MKINSLSIIFPFYNESLRINKCFQDIIKFNKCNRSMKIEYVFVDDGSSDNSYIILKESQNEYSNIIIKKHEKNIGYGGAI